MLRQSPTRDVRRSSSLTLYSSWLVLVVWIHDRRSDFLGATQHRVVTAHHKKAYQAKKLMEAILQQLAEGEFQVIHNAELPWDRPALPDALAASKPATRR